MRFSFKFICASFCLSLTSTSARAQEVAVPQHETEFCSTIEDASIDYKTLGDQRTEAEEQKNGIRVDKVERQMTLVFRSRNFHVFDIVKNKGFKIQNWVVSIINVSAPMADCHKNVRSCLSVDVHPVCSDRTVIRLWVPTSAARLATLGDKRLGYRLVVTGLFVERSGGAVNAEAPVMPESSNDFEESFARSGAMREPEYSADISGTSC